MAISYPISLPENGVESITLSMVSTTSMSQSPFTGQQQVYRHPNEYFKASVNLRQMLRYEAEPWIAALGSLFGAYGTFLMGDPSGAFPQGTISGTPTVNGSGQTGTTLTVNAITGTLKAGDYIQLGSGISARLHKVLVDVPSGGTSIEIFPRLRESPTDGDAITYVDCKGVFRLTQNESPFQYVSPKKASITFSAIEAI